MISPGPCSPNEAGISMEVIKYFAGKIPIFGVCLGHQSIAQVFGGDVVRAERLMHGKTSLMHHDGKTIFSDIPNPFTATRYHSLIVKKETLPDCLEVTSWTEEGEIMAIRHKTLPIEGVQFHPESIMTSHGKELLQNFIREIQSKCNIMLIYVNGQYVEASEAKISPYDHGYLYGLGVFETFRIYNGHPFLLDDRYNRLIEALDTLQIKWTMTKNDVMLILKDLLAKNELKHAYVRFNVSAGIDEIGLQTEMYEEPSVIVFIKPLTAPGDVVEKEGVILKQVRNTPEGTFRLKSHHYLNNILGKREIGNVVSKEGIFLTEAGYVAEGIVSNLFFVKGNVLYTPSLETGILNGITRAFIIKSAEELNIEVKAGFFTKDELLSADEVFVTNSIQEIVPLYRIEAQDFPGKVGVVTKSLMYLYGMQREKLWSRNELRRGDV